MEDCHQFNGSLDFSYSLEEGLELIDFYFPGLDFSDKLILDIGCRNGDITQAFFVKGAKVVGIDINKLAIEKAKEKHSGPEFFSGSVLNLKGFNDGTFDIIFCLGTLPYIDREKVEEVILEMKRILKPDGKIIISFQKEKNPIFLFLVKIYNYSPILFSPFLMMVAIAYFQSFNLKYFKFAFNEGLRRINFGYPKFLKDFEISSPDCRIISSKYSKTFFFGKGII